MQVTNLYVSLQDQRPDAGDNDGDVIGPNLSPASASGQVEHQNSS